MTLDAIRARLQTVEARTPGKLYGTLSRDEELLLLDVAEAAKDVDEEHQAGLPAALEHMDNYWEMKAERDAARKSYSEAVRVGAKLMDERDAALARARQLETEVRDLRIVLKNRDQSVIPPLTERVRVLEEALAKAEVTFNDFVMALHLLGHDPMAQAARIARDASGEALRGQE